MQVREAVDAKCKNPNERDKFQTYIDDLEKIVRLLLNLSGQLARAENAVQGLPDNADPKLKVSYEIIWGGGFLYSVVFLQMNAVHLVGQEASSSRL